MARLLVSVRSASEAQQAIDGGADIIDVKEPLRGPLGRADDDVISAVTALAAGRVPVSAAMGELTEAVDAVPSGLHFAKIGLAGFKSHWQMPWRRWRGEHRQAVLVAYADLHDLSEFVTFANQERPAALLIDTALKDGQSLLDHVPARQLARLIDECTVPVALAGSISFQSIDSVVSLAPAIIAVRGAACRGGRLGTVDATLVRALATRLARFAAAG